MATRLLSANDVCAANGALLSATLQRAVKATFAEYVAQLAHVLKLRQGVVATAVVRRPSRRLSASSVRKSA
jgi:hypothetical protein